MKTSARFWANPYFWLLIVLFAFCVLWHYVELLALPTGLSPGLWLGFSRHTGERLLFLLIVIVSGFEFGLRAGLIAISAVFIAMLPRALLITEYRSDALAEIALVTVIGIISCFWFSARDREKKRFQRIAGQLEESQHQIQVKEIEASSKARSLATLHIISMALSQSLDPKKVVSIAADKVAETMEVEIVLVYFLDQKEKVLNLVAYKGMSEESARELDMMKLGEGFNGRSAARGEVLIVDDVSNDQRLTRPVVRKMGIESLAIVPMKSKGQVLGTVCVGNYHPRQFLPDELELLSTIAAQIGSAVENANLYEEAVRMTHVLHESERDYRSLFENAHDAIWFHDLEGNILAANRAAETLSGYLDGAIIGINVASFLSPKEMELAREVARKLIAGDELMQPYEQRLIRRDGSEAVLLLTSSLIKFDDKLTGFQHIARDITGQKKLEENLHFYLQQITRAQEDERKRIARELHDDTAQALFALTRQIDNFLREESVATPEQAAFLQKIHRQIGDALKGIRRFSQDLRPAIIDDLGLVPALHWLVKQINEDHGIKASLNVKGKEKRLSPEVELILFRVVQEGLRNIQKHAMAKDVSVDIDLQDAQVNIIVSDNGRGFKVPHNITDLSRSGQLGLVGMQERISLLNGKLIVKSLPGEGTVINILVPL